LPTISVWKRFLSFPFKSETEARFLVQDWGHGRPWHRVVDYIPQSVIQNLASVQCMEIYKRGEEIDCIIYEFVLCKAFRKRKIIVTSQCIKYTSVYLSSEVWSVLCAPLVKQQQHHVVYRISKQNSPTATCSLLPQ
jgi:hypothetical protein